MSARFRFARHSLFGLCLLATVPAQACTIRLGPMQTAVIAYDPFITAATEGWVRVTADLVDGDRCSAIVRLTDDSGQLARTIGFGPAGAVSFRPELRPGAGVGDARDGSGADVELTTDHSHVQIEWHLAPLGDAVLAPGDYAQPLRAALDPGGADQVSAGTLTLRSIARAQANIAGAAGNFDAGSNAAVIDLGEMKTGSTGHAFLQLRANTAAHISFSSEHRGMLVNESAPQSAIRYSLSLAGTPVPLSATTIRTVDPPASLRGNSMELGVTVGDVSGALAGRYSDTITIDVSP